MRPKLDINLALKLVKPFNGSTSELNTFIVSVDLLRDYSEGVSETDILKFIKTTFNGSAIGTIENASSIDKAFQLLRNRFCVRLTPLAVEKEMSAKRQSKQPVSEYGVEIEKLASKLAAAHVVVGNN